MNKPETRSPVDTTESGYNKVTILSSGRFSNVISLSAYREKGLSKNEQKAVKSMIAYVGYKQHLDEKRVLNVLLSMFDKDELDHIPSDCYDDVMRYLIELNASEFMN